MTLINEFNIRQLCLVKDDSHDGLTSSNRTVYFCMHLINTNRVTFANKSIKNILTELFSLNYYLFADGMDFFVKDGQSIDPVCLLGDT